MKRNKILESVILLVVVASLVAIPFGISEIDKYYTSGKFPKDAQIITLTGRGKEGTWTKDRITAFNYWWKEFERAEEITIRDDGTPIIFRVTSSDVLHSFALPLYRINYELKPGEFTAIEFETERRLRSTSFLCYVYCDEDHDKMEGRLIVLQED